MGWKSERREIIVPIAGILAVLLLVGWQWLAVGWHEFRYSQIQGSVRPLAKCEEGRRLAEAWLNADGWSDRALARQREIEGNCALARMHYERIRAGG